ncbi:MAG: cation-transporting P-type ATPase [Polyangiaceae bacterium]|nr:cation-transporting P-type ATPase [Polyangiaceae bacterium]
MSLLDRLPLRRLLSSSRVRGRRVFLSEGRAQIEVRGVTPESAPRLGRALSRAGTRNPHVRWVELAAPLARASIAFERGACTAEELVGIIEAAEEECELGAASLPERSVHPVDEEQEAFAELEIAANAMGFALGALLRASPLPPLGFGVNASTVLTVVDAVPRLRRVVEEQIGRENTERALRLTLPLTQGLAQRTLAQIVELSSRATALSEARARRRTFEGRASDLLSQPGEHVPPSPPPSRAELPKGPIERYEGSAWMVSLGAFAVSLASSRSAQAALASLLVGLPKAARLGREAFASHLTSVLAARGGVTLDPAALRRLDRVDTVVLPAELFGDVDPGAGAPPWLEALIAAARDAGVSLVVAAAEPHRWSGLGADAVVLGGAALADSVRRLQNEGKVVMLADRQRSGALGLADVGVGLFRAGAPTPWGAHLLVRDDLSELPLLLFACAAARKASTQSASVALAGAGLGSFASSGGLFSNARRVMRVVNLAALGSMANGLRVSYELSKRPLPVPRDPTPWHALDVAEVLDRLGTSERGLRGRDVTLRARPRRPPPSALLELGEAIAVELDNPLTPLLAAGAGLSAVTGSLDDAGLVASVVALNAIVGGAQRFSAERALRKLERGEQILACVVRDGVPSRIPASALVRGDLVRLEAGDVVPADCRVVSAEALEVDASSLTGESAPAAKGAASTKARDLAERTSMLHEGTEIASGRATAVVVATGEDTEGRRALRAAGSAPRRGGVEARLEKITKLTAPIAGTAGLALVGIGLLRGRSVDDVVSAGVSLAVAAVPEGLPLLATAAQLAAAKRLGEAGAFVRDPRALETLGRVNVLAVDKTGTMTEGRQELVAVCARGEPAPLDALDADGTRALQVALASGAQPRASHAVDSIDVAIAAAARRLRVALPARFRPMAELPFDANRRLSAVLGAVDGGSLLALKGAVESVLAACTAGPDGAPLTDAGRAAVRARELELAARGLRVLAVAERRADAAVPIDATVVGDAELAGARLLGLLAFRDPVRREAPGLVRDLGRAGVRIVMITGDHPATARAIAEELGLLPGGEVLSGADLDGLGDDELASRSLGVAVVARATPSQKVRFVRALQKAGRCVAMAGDGTNDAPAIRIADVGLALGARATAAARASADIVLTDERLGTVARAVVEGRALWEAVKDAVSILIGGNLGEIGFTLGAGLLDGRPPLNARQLLLVNLLTDVAPAMAIAIRAPDDATLSRLSEVGPDASLGRALYKDIALRSALTASSAGGAWIVGRLTGTAARARTIGMVALVGSQLGQTLAAGHGSRPVLWTCVGSAALLTGIVQLPGVSRAFGCTPLGPVGWATALGASAVATGVSVVVPKLGRLEWRVAS